MIEIDGGNKVFDEIAYFFFRYCPKYFELQMIKSNFFYKNILLKVSLMFF